MDHRRRRTEDHVDDIEANFFPGDFGMAGVLTSRAQQAELLLFPDRAVVGIHCVDLVWGLGTLHCLTQQEPAGGG